MAQNSFYNSSSYYYSESTAIIDTFVAPYLTLASSITMGVVLSKTQSHYNKLQILGWLLLICKVKSSFIFLVCCITSGVFQN